MATADRDYLIQRARTKSLTAEMFDYEKLTCPYSLSMLFSSSDIWNLYELASSPKWTGKPVAKMKAIDNIMRSRGFVKIQAGTNRICYRYLEDTSFVVKVAYDGGGLKDNPAEYMNQEYLKPFCTKVFECAPNGVIASFERVHAIKSREEYYVNAPYVYDLIKNVVIFSGYIMEDIGTNYFMNIGIREGFGPVFLDFSFLYELNGNKLYCTKPDNNSASGVCDGEIDFDVGYNFLYCKKCGCKYKAIELAKRVADTRLTKRQRQRIGGIKMKLEFNGGDKAKNEVVELNNNGFAASTPSLTVVPSTVKSSDAPRRNSSSISVNFGSRAERRNPNQSKLVLDIKKVSVDGTEEKKEEPKVVTETKKNEDGSFTYTSTLEEPKKEEEKNLIEVSSADSKSIEGTVETDHSDGESPVEMITIDTFRDKLFSLVDEYKYLKSSTTEAPESDIMTFIDEIIAFDPEFDNLIHPKKEDDEYYLYDDEEGNDEEPADEEDNEEETEEASTSDDTTNTNDDTAYDSNVSRFEGCIVDLHNIIDSAEPENVLLIKNVGASGYVTVGDNQLFVIDMIDGNYINTLSITSKDYLENLEKQVAQYENLELKEAPTGA